MCLILIFVKNLNLIIMKKLLFIFGFMFVTTVISAQTKQIWVNGYYKSDGNYVSGYYKSVPDNTSTNNYSYYNNINPNTGNQGTQKLYYNTTPTQSRTLYTGVNGGVYYINDNGNKVYIKTK